MEATALLFSQATLWPVAVLPVFIGTRARFWRRDVLHAAPHAHAVHYDPATSGGNWTHDRCAARPDNRCAMRPDTTGSSDAPGAVGGIRVGGANGHDSCERGEGKSSEYEQAHSRTPLVVLGECAKHHTRSPPGDIDPKGNGAPWGLA